MCIRNATNINTFSEKKRVFWKIDTQSNLLFLIDAKIFHKNGMVSDKIVSIK